MYDDEELFGSWKEQISMALIAESIMISFKEFSYEKTNWFFFTKNINVNIAPNILTLIVSILYSLSIYFRYHLNFIDKPKVITINILNILFCSSLLSVLISNDYFYIPIIGETSFTSQSFCIFLLVFSWLGMKSLNIFIFKALFGSPMDFSCNSCFNYKKKEYERYEMKKKFLIYIFFLIFPFFLYLF